MHGTSKHEQMVKRKYVCNENLVTPKPTENGKQREKQTEPGKKHHSVDNRKVNENNENNCEALS